MRMKLRLSDFLPISREKSGLKKLLKELCPKPKKDKPPFDDSVLLKRYVG